MTEKCPDCGSSVKYYHDSDYTTVGGNQMITITPDELRELLHSWWVIRDRLIDVNSRVEAMEDVLKKIELTDPLFDEEN